MFRRLAAAFGGLYVARTTVGSRAEAEALARRLIDDRIAACAHITEVSSIYRWEGTRRQETEFLVEARTKQSHRGLLLKAMASQHPYQVPLLEGWNVSDVPNDYRAWAENEVR